MKYILGIISIIILLIAIAIGAFYIGTKTTTNKTGMTTTPTPTAFVSAETPTPTTTVPKTVEAGGVLVFNKYSLDLPEGWASQREQGENMDKLTLSKLGYNLILYQFAGGGGGCLYPGDQDLPMAQTFSSFVEVKNTNGFIFRRGQNDSGPNSFTYCQKNNTDGSFGSPTSFGGISLTTPGTPDKNAVVFPEADAIVASLKKI
jgi:hypothetical protein